MSIATLKKKTNLGGNPRNDPISGVGNKGFALNGTLRNIGGVGQFRMVSNVTRTRYRGNTPIGWGGTLGQYPVYIFNSGDCCTNDENIVKKSTKNTMGMIDERFKGILFGTYPNTWVKDDENSYRITKTQGQYIGAITNKVGSCNFSKPLCCNIDNKCTCTQGRYIFIGTKKKLFYNPTTKNVANFSPYGETMTQGVYITAGGVAKNNNLPTPSCMQHYPPMLSHNGCNSNVITWQQAKAVGIMPPDYMECPPCNVNKCDIICGSSYIAPTPVPPTPPVPDFLSSIATETSPNNWVLNANTTINSNEILTIPINNTLTIPLGLELANNGTIANNGVITNNGTITMNGGNITNNGVILNNSTITNYATITNNGSIINNSAGNITNNSSGTITNNSSASISNNGNLNINAGIFNNNGTINNETGALFYGSVIITNNGTINNKSGAYITGGIGITNNGTINNETGGNIFISYIINNYGTITNQNSGNIENYGTITNYAGGTINSTGGNINNYQTINNNSDINNAGTFDNKTGATINNNGTGIIYNNGPLINNGNIPNNGTISNYSIAIITNYNIITNGATINNYNGATINNESGSVINNYFNIYNFTSSNITNKSGATINNLAFINNYLSQGATFTNNGTYTGNPPNNL